MKKGLLIIVIGIVLSVLSLCLFGVGYMFYENPDDPVENTVVILQLEEDKGTIMHLPPGDYEVWYEPQWGVGGNKPVNLVIRDQNGVEVYNQSNHSSSTVYVYNDVTWQRIGGFEVLQEGDFNATSSVSARVHITEPLEGVDESGTSIAICCMGSFALLLGIIVLIIGVVVLIIQVYFSGVKKAWKQFAQEIGGKYETRSALLGDRVRLDFEDWTIYLTRLQKDRKQNTRVTALYDNPSGFSWTIHRKSFVMDLQDALRKDPDPVVFKKYDPNLVIRANDKRRMKALLSNKRIRRLLLAQEDIYLSSHWRVIYLDDLPKGKKELFFFRRGLITDVERLKRIFELFKELLITLEEIEDDYY
jgi:hypothetical protein